MAAEPHTLHCALVPATCRHVMRDIATCVICQRELAPYREHVDTCGARCYKKLLQLQREAE